MGRLCSEGGSSGSGVLSVEHDGVPAPPLAVSYSKVLQHHVWITSFVHSNEKIHWGVLSK